MRFLLLLFLSLLWLHPTTATAQETEAQLQLRSGVRVTSPVSSVVYIDHIEVGTTPYDAQMPPGQYTIRIAADGFKPYVRRVTIKENSIVQLAAELEEGAGTVEFQSNIPGSQVILDEQTFILPIRIDTLPEGTHKWTILAGGHESASGLLTFTTGKNIYIYRELASSKGKASFDSTPEGATVYIDGEVLGTTPLEIEDLDSAVHSVAIRKSGYSLMFRTMDTSRGNKGEVKAALSKIGSKLIIKTGDSSAEVFIEDTPIGKGKKISVGKVEKGTYDIRIVADGQKPLQSHIRVPASGKVVYNATLIPEDGTGNPSLDRRGSEPNVILFGGLGAGAVVGGVAALIIVQAIQPDPLPSGDIVLELP